MSGATTTILVTLATLALALTAVERGRGGTRELALVASLAAVAAAGRVLTAAIPSVQPVTLICLLAGAALGWRAGMAVGPIAALISNGFLGQGPWTPGQMGLWALVGLTGALMGPLAGNRWVLAMVAAAWGPLFGWGMNLWELATFGPKVSWAAFIASGARSLPFDVAGGVGNVVFALAGGATLLAMLKRYAARCRVQLDAVAPPEVVAIDSIDSTRARSSR